MSFIPAFELGLWNAWILVLTMFLLIMGLSPLVMNLFFGSKISKESSKRHSAQPKLSEFEKKIDNLFTLTLLTLLGYSIFLPLELNTVWFIAGLFVYLISMIFGFIAIINFTQAPMDKPATKGVYNISRNPMYFSMFLTFIGIGLTCVSWFFLLLTMIWLLLADRGVVAEERLCLETYGDSYRKYMKNTPRWIGIPKSKTRKGLQTAIKRKSFWV